MQLTLAREMYVNVKTNTLRIFMEFHSFINIVKKYILIV